MYPGASCLECVTCLTSGITFIIIWWCIWCSKWQMWFVSHQWQCGEVDTCSLWLSILCHRSRFWLVYVDKCFVSDSFVSRCVIWDTTAIGGNVQNPWPAHICRKVFCQWHVDLSLVAECVVSVTDLISLWKMCVSDCVVCLDFVRNRSALLWSYAPNLIIKLWKAAVKIKHLHHSDFQLFSERTEHRLSALCAELMVSVLCTNVQILFTISVTMYSQGETEWKVLL